MENAIFLYSTPKPVEVCSIRIVLHTPSATVTEVDQMPSLTGKKWRWRAGALTQPTASIGELADHFLRSRKVDEESSMAGMDARLFRDFEKAQQRIQEAIEDGERVTIFGDYDCDGITGTTIMARFLHRKGLLPRLRLPNRLREGYGLKSAHVQECIKDGCSLLITIDTGVTALAAVTEAKAAGIDTIIMDHHTLPRTLPNAFAILHPRFLHNGEYDNDASPCGAGVVWSFVDTFEREAKTWPWEDRETDLALAAIGTVADVVELRGGNRTLVREGIAALEQLKEGPLFLLRLQTGITMTSRITSRDIGFRIAPRINAAGRMDDPHIALDALLGNAQALLALESLNQKRQELVASLLENMSEPAPDDLFICIAEPHCTSGVCGLIAGKLCEKYGKPTLVASAVNGYCVASLRSIPDYDVTAALERNKHLLTDWGGHAMAAGCTFAEEQLQEIRSSLNADAREYIAESSLGQSMEIDALLHPGLIGSHLCETLEILEPFGQGNPEPRFLLQGVHLEEARTVGATGKHLQARVLGNAVIGFGHGHLLSHTRETLDIVCRVGVNTWRGVQRAQIHLEDMRIHSPSLALTQLAEPAPAPHPL